MLIILDRDGVINEESPHYIKSPDEWHPIPGSLEAIAKLKHAGHQVVVATNQSGIARGLYTEQTLALIHQKMQDHLAQFGAKLDGIFYCPHHPQEHCKCRKPKPGMLLQIKEQLGIDLRSSLLIGDSERDLEAATRVGAKPILVLTGNGKKTADTLRDKIQTFTNLSAATNALLDSR